MKINFDTWKSFDDCPKRFHLEYVKKDPISKDEYHRVYKRLVQKYMEMFCNTWRYTTPYQPLDMIQNNLKIISDGVFQASIVNWSGFGRVGKEEILTQAATDIFAIMDCSDTQNYFLNTESNRIIEVQLQNGHVLNESLDFIHKNPVGNSTLLFIGTGTKKIGSPDTFQLLFSTLLYFFHFKVIPDQIGFFYYRYNVFNPVPLTLDYLNEFRARISLDIKKMTAGSSFEATPSAKTCKYCPFNQSCQDHLTDKAKRARKSKLSMDGDGIIEFGL